LRTWFDRKYEKPAREALWKLIERAHQSTQEPLQRISGTLTRWVDPMVRDVRNRYTNGMTEGFNNKIKLIQRMAYGLRNAHNRRKRILAWCGAPSSLASMMAKSQKISLITPRGRFTGTIQRIPIRLRATQGASLDIDASIYVTEDDWHFGNFLGYTGFLERFRSAIDPSTYTFYFGKYDID